MSAKQGSNKGIYIFWISIIVAIVAVVLFFVIPRTDYNLAYNNFVGVKANTSEENFYDMTIAKYVEEIQEKYSSTLNTDNKNKLTNLSTIQKTLFLSDTFNQTALTFIRDNGNYNALVGAQNSAKSDLNSSIDIFQSYCKVSITNLFNQTSIGANAINEVIGVFNTKFQELTVKYILFYEKSADIIINCSMRGLEMNDEDINNHKSIISNLKNQQTTLNSVQINSIYNNAQIFYSTI